MSRTIRKNPSHHCPEGKHCEWCLKNRMVKHVKQLDKSKYDEQETSEENKA